MFKAISGALSLALTILVLQLFLPEVAAGLVDIILKMITIIDELLNQAVKTMPQ